VSPIDLVRAFVEAINSHDVDGAVAMLADDHLFIDGVGLETQGRVQVQETWQQHLGTFPDYRINIKDIEERDGVVEIRGTARGIVPGSADDELIMAGLEVPGTWRAVVRDGLITEWRVSSEL
jgi:limonene-1,2-epoxide hydrolase